MSENMSAALVQVGRENRATMLKGLLATAAGWKPAGYDAGVARRRDCVNGQQIGALKAELERRYPETAKEISPFVVPLVAHLYRQRSTIYRVAPKRELVGGDAELMGKVYEDAAIDCCLQRLERISAACGVAFARIGWDVAAGRLMLNHYWPDRVHPIMNPDRPADLAACLGLLAEITSEAGLRPTQDQRRYELWQPVGDGTWTRSIISEYESDPNELVEQLPYPALPFVALSFVQPDDALFPELSDDDLVVNDAVNVACSDLLHTVSRQSFNQLTYSGPPLKKERLCVGVGDVLSSEEGGMWGNISYSPQIQPVTDLLRERVGQHLVLGGVSPNSASAKPDYVSGVAAKIQNAPMMEARAERIPVVREFEQRMLWPTIKAIAAGGGVHLSGDLKWQPGPLSLPIDDEAEFRLAQGRVASDLSTWPQEMVRSGSSPTVEEAAAAYESNKAYNDVHAPLRSYGIPFVKSDTMAALQGTAAQEEAGGGVTSSPGTDVKRVG